MEREKFIKEFNQASDQLDENKFKEVIKRNVSSQINNGKVDGHFFIICMEELAELSQQVSKSGRGKCDIANLLQEIADVIIILEGLKEAHFLGTSEIHKALNVKIDRIEDILNEKGVYL